MRAEWQDAKKSSRDATRQAAGASNQQRDGAARAGEVLVPVETASWQDMPERAPHAPSDVTPADVTVADSASADRASSACHPEELVLDMSSEAIRLIARFASGVREEIGAVPLAAGDFRSGIDALRRQAEACGAVPLALWLPPDQILARRYVLMRGSRDRAVALRRLAEDTGRRASELTIALSPAGDGELVIVLGASRRTVAEALDYARRWGFRPTRVSTEAEALRFGAAGPDFELPVPAARPDGLRARQALAAAVAMLAIGLGGWGAYSLLPAAEPDPVVLASASEVVTRPAEDDANVPERSPSPVGRTHASPLEATRPVPGPVPGRVPGRVPVPVPAQLPETLPLRTGYPLDGNAPAGAILPAGLAPAAPDAALELALGSEAPERRDPALPQAAGSESAPDPAAEVASLRAGIDRVRAEHRGDDARDEARDEARDAAEPENGALAAADNATEPGDGDLVLAATDGPPIPVPRPGRAAQSGAPGDDAASTADEAASGEVAVDEVALADAGQEDAGQEDIGQEDIVEAEGSDVLPRPLDLSEFASGCGAGAAAAGRA